MGGLVLAFKNFIPRRGIFGSDWIAFKNFEFMFRNPTFWLTVKNTLLYNGVFLVTNVVFPMSLALAINEVRSKKLARVFQTGMIMPHSSFLMLWYPSFSLPLSARRGPLL